MSGRPSYKTARTSRVEMTEIVLPEDSNQFGHAWGGGGKLEDRVPVHQLHWHGLRGGSEIQGAAPNLPTVLPRRYSPWAYRARG